MAAKKKAVRRDVTYAERAAFARMAEKPGAVMADEFGNLWRYNDAAKRFEFAFSDSEPRWESSEIFTVCPPFTDYVEPPRPLTDEQIVDHLTEAAREHRVWAVDSASSANRTTLTQVAKAYDMAAKLLSTRRLP